MKKKLTALALVVVLLAVAVVGGSLAYFTDTKEATNVMTFGNVSIEMTELERKPGVPHVGDATDNLQAFTQNQKVFPAAVKGDGAYTAEASNGFYWKEYVYTGTAWNGLWNDELLGNVIDKFVFVRNTGTESVYFRTFIAVECPTGWGVGDAGLGDEIGLNVGVLYDSEYLGTINIGGGDYALYVCRYDDGSALEAGNQAHPSLLQIVFNHKLTQEDMEKLGETFDVKVLTQACQTEGFDNMDQALNAAFGELTDGYNPWAIANP